jgi:hypothetical protein
LFLFHFYVVAIVEVVVIVIVLVVGDILLQDVFNGTDSIHWKGKS